MTEAEAKEILKSGGYTNIYSWFDSPDQSYEEHTHVSETAHIIVAGDMTIGIGSELHHLHQGDRFDVPAGAPHTAVMGSDGCSYVVGER